MEVRVLAVHWIRADILRLQVDTRTVTSVPLHGSAHWRPEGRTHLHISYSAMWFYHSHPGRQRQAIYSEMIFQLPSLSVLLQFTDTAWVNITSALSAGRQGPRRPVIKNACLVGRLGSGPRLVGELGLGHRIVGRLGSGPRLVGRLGSAPRVVGRLGLEPRLVGRIGSGSRFVGRLGSGPRVVGRLVLGPRLVGRLGSGPRLVADRFTGTP